MSQARSREELIRQDVQDLHSLGYAQELFRTIEAEFEHAAEELKGPATA
jgi:hypothetical protein